MLKKVQSRGEVSPATVSVPVRTGEVQPPAKRFKAEEHGKGRSGDLQISSLPLISKAPQAPGKTLAHWRVQHEPTSTRKASTPPLDLRASAESMLSELLATIPCFDPDVSSEVKGIIEDLRSGKATRVEVHRVGNARGLTVLLGTGDTYRLSWKADQELRLTVRRLRDGKAVQWSYRVIPPLMPKTKGLLNSTYQLGACLGFGAEKDVYETQFPDLVVAVQSRKQVNLQREVEDLWKLHELGLPVVHVHEVGDFQISRDGITRTHRAMVMKRYIGSSKGSLPDWIDVLKKYGNHNTLESLALIERLIEEKGIDIADLQFMLAPDGGLVIADPLEITVGPSVRAANEPGLQDLRRALYFANLLKT